MPAMSSASVAVTSPMRSRTRRYALSDPAREIRLDRGEDERRRTGDDERADDPTEGVEVTPLDAVVDGELGQVRRGQSDSCEAEQRDEREGGPPGVRAHQPDEDA